MTTLSFEKYAVFQTTIPDIMVIAGTIVTENTTPTRKAGKGYTVSKNGTGVYRITFNRIVPRIFAATAIYCGTAARLLKKVAHTEGNNYVEFRFEDTSASAAEPGATDELEFIVIGSTNKVPKT